MKNSLKLHTHHPIIAHLPQDAALLSIVGSTPDEYSWIMNNFINIRVNHKLQYDDFYREDMWYNCYYIEDNAMTKQFILNNFSDFIDFILRCIDNGYYVIPYLNKRQIRAYNFDINARHSPLIYGYNLSEKVVLLCDFFTEYYTTATASFEEIKYAIDYTEHDHEWYPYKLFHIIRKKEGYKHRFNLCALIKQLEDYYTSADKTGTYDQFMTNDMEEKLFFGIEEYKAMVFGMDSYDMLLHVIENNAAWIRLFFLFRAHKTIMRHRLEYLDKRYGLPEFEQLYVLNEQMERLSTINQNLYIKSLLSPQSHWINKAIDNTLMMKKNDALFTQKLIGSLKQLERKTIMKEDCKARS